MIEKYDEEEFVDEELTCSVKYLNGINYLDILKKYTEEREKKQEKEIENNK